MFVDPYESDEDRILRAHRILCHLLAMRYQEISTVLEYAARKGIDESDLRAAMRIHGTASEVTRHGRKVWKRARKARG